MELITNIFLLPFYKIANAVMPKPKFEPTQQLSEEQQDVMKKYSQKKMILILSLALITYYGIYRLIKKNK
tara:strand:+ start:879 stop:1088 length:210 start_codon:yes stop_codon:yes gene_type:complete